MVADWIAAGLDPEKSTFFVQSLVPEHAELYPAAVDGRAGAVARARADLQGAAGATSRTRTCRRSASSAIRCCRRPTSRSTTRSSSRSATTRSRTSSCRARRCAASTTSTATVLVEPQPLLTPMSRLPGLDGDKKMSKSIGNTIDLADDAETVEKRVRADVHRSQARPRRHSRDRRRQPGVHLPRRLQPGHGGSRRPEGALPRRQGRRRRGQDQAGQGAQRAISIRSATRRAEVLARPGYVQGNPARRIEEGARRRRARRWSASATR